MMFCDRCGSGEIGRPVREIRLCAQCTEARTVENEHDLKRAFTQLLLTGSTEVLYTRAPE
jgi:uncharacterized protein (DUF983 family)